MKFSGKDRAMLPFIGIGFELFALCLAGIYVGAEIDEYFKMGGLATGLLLFILFLSWCFHVTVLVKQMERHRQDESPD